MPRTTRAVSAAAATAAVLLLGACSGGSKPEAKPSPSPTTATPSPSATAKPVAATCPLTGKPPTKGQRLGRAALAIKIDNVSDARPQSGVDRADLVIEETVEGGLTRLMAVFQCDAVPRVGPIRSARTSDSDLLRLFNGQVVFAFSGANSRALAQVRANSHAVLLSMDAGGGYFHRDYSRPAPHNVYSSTTTLLKAGVARKKGIKAPRPVFRYGKPKAGGKAAKSASVSWPFASAGWTWNGHAWARTQGGTPDLMTSGHRVAASNVIIMSIDVKASGLHDVLGNASPEDVVTGSGNLWLLRDGRVYKGKWKRPTAAKRLRMFDLAGRPLPLRAGRTWIELLPRPRQPTIS
jgi:hypothetical protein